MLTVSVLAAAVSFFITPPSLSTFSSIDWKTLAILFLLLLILEGFKRENLFLPLIRLSGRLKTQTGLSCFLVFGVFFSSMFVTNDVSLIIFVPLTIVLFRSSGMEQKILPVLVLENIAAIRGSLLTPFGSPQNLFLFSQSGMDVASFLLMMLPLCAGSLLLLLLFLLFLHHRGLRERLTVPEQIGDPWAEERKGIRILYLCLFAAAVFVIVSRTRFWPVFAGIAVLLLLIFDRRVFRSADYALILTFFCFFLFSSAIASNESIAAFLRSAVSGREYFWSIGLSQLISNVPAAIVLWPFTEQLPPLIYGLDTAGLVTVIGSLASVIALRIYTRYYPGAGGRFLLWFEGISLAFFFIVFPLQWLLLHALGY
ncbi:MAG: citrate transporter [Clostridia bacterium]|nr:citrate transporter [Clostridia bacterium]